MTTINHFTHAAGNPTLRREGVTATICYLIQPDLRSFRHSTGSFAGKNMLGQVLVNGIFVNWELVKKPVDDKTTFQDLEAQRIRLDR